MTSIVDGNGSVSIALAASSVSVANGTLSWVHDTIGGAATGLALDHTERPRELKFAARYALNENALVLCHSLMVGWQAAACPCCSRGRHRQTSLPMPRSPNPNSYPVSTLPGSFDHWVARSAIENP